MAGTAKQVRSGRAPIVDSAIRNFNERGYHGTSMRDIAAGAGVTVASIYHHFAAKQDVLVRIMAGTMTDLLEVTTAAAAAAGGEAASARARLEAVVDAWVRFHTERQAEARIGASEMRSLEGEGRELVIGLRDQEELLFRGIIEDGVERGEFATRFPREAARAVLNMGSTISTWYHLGGVLTPEDMAERYRDFALGTVRG